MSEAVGNPIRDLLEIEKEQQITLIKARGQLVIEISKPQSTTPCSTRQRRRWKSSKTAISKMNNQAYDKSTCIPDGGVCRVKMSTRPTVGAHLHGGRRFYVGCNHP